MRVYAAVTWCVDDGEYFVGVFSTLESAALAAGVSAEDVIPIDPLDRPRGEDTCWMLDTSDKSGVIIYGYVFGTDRWE